MFKLISEERQTSLLDNADLSAGIGIMNINELG